MGKSTKIEVSYFAAGIVAHLASDFGDAWNLPTIPKDEISNELMMIVSQWETPDSEMVAYRSFTPFFPLMAVEQEYSVQLWAVWAIHHVCTKNPRRYLPMLVYQEGIRVIATLVDANVQGMVYVMCQEILDIVVKESVMGKSVLSALQKEIEKARLSKAYTKKGEKNQTSKSKFNIHSETSKEVIDNRDSEKNKNLNLCAIIINQNDSNTEDQNVNNDLSDNDEPMRENQEV